MDYLAVAAEPSDFGAGNWSHSWEWHAVYYEQDEQPVDGGTEIFTTSISITFPDGHANMYKIIRLKPPLPG